MLKLPKRIERFIKKRKDRIKSLNEENQLMKERIKNLENRLLYYEKSNTSSSARKFSKKKKQDKKKSSKK